MCIIDAAGSWQIILPMPNLERTYLFDKESEAVLLCLQYEQCAGPQKQEVINECIRKNGVRGFFGTIV